MTDTPISAFRVYPDGRPGTDEAQERGGATSGSESRHEEDRGGEGRSSKGIASRAAQRAQERLGKLAPSDEPGEGHIFGPHVDGTSLRLDPDEAYCEEEGEVFDQFGESVLDDLDRRRCPYCDTQLQSYDKVYHMEKYVEEFPDECRSCGENDRMEGSFQCEECAEKFSKSDDAPVLGDLDQEEDPDLRAIDEAFFKAYDRTVWWLPSPGDGLEKAPNMWREDDRVPEFVKESIREVIKGDAVYNTFQDLPPRAARVIEDEIEDSLTQPQGWSINSVAERLTEEFGSLAKDHAGLIARNETAAVLNEARINAYEESEGEDETFEFYWSGPTDHRTTEICKAIKAEIADRGGAVPLDELTDILREKARDHIDQGGTPGRVDQLMAHYQCRHTAVREVYL